MKSTNWRKDKAMTATKHFDKELIWRRNVLWAMMLPSAIFKAMIKFLFTMFVLPLRRLYVCLFVAMLCAVCVVAMVMNSPSSLFRLWTIGRHSISYLLYCIELAYWPFQWLFSAISEGRPQYGCFLLNALDRQTEFCALKLQQAEFNVPEIHRPLEVLTKVSTRNTGIVSTAHHFAAAQKNVYHLQNLSRYVEQPARQHLSDATTNLTLLWDDTSDGLHSYSITLAEGLDTAIYTVGM